MSFVPTSWQQPVLTAEFTAVGVTRMLDAIRQVCPKARFYQASSSEMFGKVRETPQNETTPFYPRTPYGVAKVYGHLHHGQLPRELRHVRLLRHPVQPRVAAPRPGVRHPQDHRRRGPHQARPGSNELRLGNLEAKRDWGFAGDYVRAMWLMLQQDEPDDYVIGTGETHTRRGVRGDRLRPRRPRLAQHVVVDPRFFRPAEVDLLLADPTKAQSRLGWQPEVKFEQLVHMMVDADLAAVCGVRPAPRRIVA